MDGMNDDRCLHGLLSALLENEHAKDLATALARMTSRGAAAAAPAPDYGDTSGSSSGSEAADDDDDNDDDDEVEF